jgi:hypothetical protein
MGKKSKQEVVKAPVYGRPPAGTPSRFACTATHAQCAAIRAVQVTLCSRLEIKFDPEKIGNFVTGFAKVCYPSPLS